MKRAAFAPLASAALATALTALPASPGRAEDDVATPERAYVRAVAAMRALANPPYATYRSAWHSDGLAFEFTQEERRIVIDVGIGGSLRHEESYAAAYRNEDRLLSFTSGAGEKLVGTGHLLEPTWAGAYDILRYGLRGSAPQPMATAQPIETTPPVEAEPEPEAAASASAGEPHEIGAVTAISPLYYRVSDAGTRACGERGTGRALHLVARSSIQRHPLTDVVLDPESGRFCSMTFVIKESGLAGITGHYTIDFAPYGDYWLVTGGTIDVNVRLFGISAKHATLNWAISDLTTPATVPDDAFVVASPAPSRPS